MSTVDVKSHLFFFEDEDGNEIIIPGYFPLYDKMEIIEIENTPTSQVGLQAETCR